MGAVPALYLKIIGELILFIVILLVVFSPEGILSNAVVYVNAIEPCLIQNWAAASMSVASWAPGEFGTDYRTLGAAHKIKIETKSGWPELVVKEAKGISLDTRYQCLTKLALPSGPCQVSNRSITLATKPQTLVISKTYSGSGCNVNISAS